MPSALPTMSRSQYAPEKYLLEYVPLFAVLCKQSEDSPRAMAIELTPDSLAGAQPQSAIDYKENAPAPVRSLRGGGRSFRSRFRLTNSALIRRNFSSRARELSGGDAIILSIPKSGRTWLRAFLCAYFCKRFGLAFTLRPGRHAVPG